MIDLPLPAGLLTATLLTLASASGGALASFLPWHEGARRARLPLYWGLGFAPLLLGLATVAALAALPGATHGVHIAFAMALLALPVLAAVPQQRWRLLSVEVPRESGWMERVLLALLLAWWTVLLVNALFLPLLQNDALEYTIVGRALFESRSLADYPQVRPDAGSSGFFGPWTHPPLYVALIYLSNAVQGHADAPGLMRLWAPWALIAATGVVYGLGAMASRTAGLLAALLLLSTPLLFLGADSALIDSLPVLGLLLAAGALFGMDGPSLRRGAGVGAALGLALWTHSQALLFVPLVGAVLAGALLLAPAGQRVPGARLLEGSMALGLAALIACWPYLRNLAIFGSLISDNPVVFALPEQSWPDYFRIGRGVDHWPAIVQYGWFKGWFALEAFGFVFWIMLGGLALFGWRRSAAGAADTVYRLSLVLLACYLLGVVTSTAFDMDLMIKNERYLLVIVPFVGLVAAFCISPVLVRRSLMATAVAAAFVLLFSAQLLALLAYRFSGTGPLLVSPVERKLDAAPEYQAVRFLRENTPLSALVFSMRPADMYYAGRRMLSYLDPRLVPFYSAREPAEALATLKALGVTHVHLPDYGLPPLYDSQLHKILRSLNMATLVFQADGYQIYRLEPSGLAEGEPLDLLSGQVAWTRTSVLVLGGRKALSSMNREAEAVDIRRASEARPLLRLFHRDWTTALTASSRAGEAPSGPLGLPVQGGQEYGIDLRLEGRGLVRVWVRQFDERGPLRDAYLRSRPAVLLADFTLGSRHSERAFSRRIRTLLGARYATLTVEHVGASCLSVRSAVLVPLHKIPQ